MKTIAEINQTLNAFQKQFGICAMEAQQGSEAWLALKLGVLSASNAHKIVPKSRGNGDGRYTYLCELVAQVCTSQMNEVTSIEMQWGKDNEDAARATYELSTGNKITELPFVFKDESFREGCSPDGILNDKKGIEIKCPYNTVHFIKFLDGDKIKEEYHWQAQYTMRVMDAGEWEFVQFDPRVRNRPFKSLTVPRDEEKQKILADAVPAFLSEMDEMLGRIGVKFGEHWKQIKL